MITSCPFSVFLPWVGRGSCTTFCLAFSDKISNRMQTYVPGLIIIIINNQSHLYMESDEAEIDIYAILKH